MFNLSTCLQYRKPVQALANWSPGHTSSCVLYLLMFLIKSNHRSQLSNASHHRLGWPAFSVLDPKGNKLDTEPNHFLCSSFLPPRTIWLLANASSLQLYYAIVLLPLSSAFTQQTSQPRLHKHSHWCWYSLQIHQRHMNMTNLCFLSQSSQVIPRPCPLQVALPNT